MANLVDWMPWPPFTRPAGRFRRSSEACRMGVKNNRPENRFSRLLARLPARPCLPWETKLIPGGGQGYDLLQTCRHRRPRCAVIQTHNGVLGPFTVVQALVKRLGSERPFFGSVVINPCGTCLVWVRGAQWPDELARPDTHLMARGRFDLGIVAPDYVIPGQGAA